MNRIFGYVAAAITAVAAMVSCGSNGKALLPNVSGKAGEVIVVVDREGWEGNLGNEIRGLLARDCEFLPQREPLYSLVNLAPGSFTDMFKYHRNIVIFNVDTTIAPMCGPSRNVSSRLTPPLPIPLSWSFVKMVRI